VGAGDEHWIGHERGPVKKPIILIWRRLLMFSIERRGAACLGSENADFTIRLLANIATCDIGDL